MCGKGVVAYVCVLTEILKIKRKRRVMTLAATVEVSDKGVMRIAAV
jgi:hypothetical protein